MQKNSPEQPELYASPFASGIQMNASTATNPISPNNREFSNTTDFATESDLLVPLEGSGATIAAAEVIRLLTTLFVPLAFGVIAFLGIIGNALVIIIVSTNPQMRSTTNVLILNLAFADLLFIVFCVPFTATDYVLNDWPFGLTVCQAVQYLIYVTSYVSIYTLILMSIDRFLAVVFPVASLGFRTVKNASLAILLTWGLIGSLSAPIWLAHHLEFKNMSHLRPPAESADLDDRPEDQQQYQVEAKYWCRFAAHSYSERGFYVAFFVSGYAIPTILIIILYVVMLRRLWNPSTSMRRGSHNKLSKESLRNKRRVTRLVLVVIVVFCVCWTPIQFVLLFRAIGLYQIKGPEDYIFIIFQIFSHVLAYVNSCVNPILYAFLSDNFRKAFKHWLPHCLFCFNRSQGNDGLGARGRLGGGRVGHGNRNNNSRMIRDRSYGPGSMIKYEMTTFRISTRSRRARKVRAKRKKSHMSSIAEAVAASNEAGVPDNQGQEQALPLASASGAPAGLSVAPVTPLLGSEQIHRSNGSAGTLDVASPDDGHKVGGTGAGQQEQLNSADIGDIGPQEPSVEKYSLIEKGRECSTGMAAGSHDDDDDVDRGLDSKADQGRAGTPPVCQQQPSSTTPEQNHRVFRTFGPAAGGDGVEETPRQLEDLDEVETSHLMEVVVPDEEKTCPNKELIFHHDEDAILEKMNAEVIIEQAAGLDENVENEDEEDDEEDEDSCQCSSCSSCCHLDDVASCRDRGCSILLTEVQDPAAPLTTAHRLRCAAHLVATKPPLLNAFSEDFSVLRSKVKKTDGNGDEETESNLKANKVHASTSCPSFECGGASFVMIKSS